MRDWIVGLGALLSAGAAQGGTPSEPRPMRPGWLVLQLPDGVELHYLPLAVTLKDYPKEARRAGDEGTSLLNLQVDSSGLTGRSTAGSSGSPVLDEQACRVYQKRGRFDLRGASEPVTIQAPVRWVLVD